MAKLVNNKTQDKKPIDPLPPKEEKVDPPKHSNKKLKQTESDLDQNFTEEQESQNDIFLSQSVGLDLSVDSNALQQFDYDESVEDVTK